MTDQIAGSTAKSPETGWWRESVWSLDPVGNFGDDAISGAYTAYYTNGTCRAEISYYTVYDGADEGTAYYGVTESMFGPWTVRLDDDGHDCGHEQVERECAPAGLRSHFSAEAADAYALERALADVAWIFDAHDPSPAICLIR